MKKKILALMLCLAMMLSNVPQTSAADELTEGNFTYVIESNGEATLTGVLEDVEELYLPDTLGGRPVTAIASKAIENPTSRFIVIPESVNLLKRDALLNCNETDVYVMCKTVEMDDNAGIRAKRLFVYSGAKNVFGRVYLLEEFPPEPWLLEEHTENGLTYGVKDGEAILLNVEDNTEINVPETLGGCRVTYIAPYCFRYVKNASSVTLPDCIRSVGVSAVSNGSIQNAVKLPAALEYIGDYAFYQTITTGDLLSAVHIGTSAFYKNQRTEIKFGDQLEYIASTAFSDNYINAVTIPASVKYIGKNAFWCGYDVPAELVMTVLTRDAVCDGALERVCKVIGYKESTAMYEAFKLDITFEDIETGEIRPGKYNTEVAGLTYSVYYDHAEVIDVCDIETEYELVAVAETVDGKPVTVIKSGAFAGLKTKKLVLPNTVTTLEDEAFVSCHMQSIVMSENIEELGAESFRSCTNLRLIFWADNACEIKVTPDWTGTTELFGFCKGAIFITNPNSKVEHFAKSESFPVLLNEEGVTYLTDGVGVYSVKDNEAKLHAMYYEGNSNDPVEYYIPDEIEGHPVTTIASNAVWGRVWTIYLGKYVKVVENGAFDGCIEMSRLVTTPAVEYLPHPLFSSYVDGGKIYGYANTYAERFAKEHGYLFYPLDSVPFEDVSKDDWYFNAVYYCYWTGLMNGNSHTSFAPNGTTTRAMVAQVLYNMSGAPHFNWEYGFKDVNNWDWYSMAVNWCRYYGLAYGTSAHYFSPNQNVTREQVATFFYRYASAVGIAVTANGDLSGFNDAKKVSDYAEEAMRWAVEYGIINGQTATKLNPQGYATRAEIATILMRFVAYAEKNLAQ